MDLSVVHNSDHPLGELMRDELSGADAFSGASAFLTSAGLEYILPDVQRILNSEGAVSLIHGADFRITDPTAIRRLVELNDRHIRMSYKVYFGWDLTRKHRFHPKLYLWTADYSSYTAVVGSSNLTLGGLSNNTEVNTIMRGLATERPIRQCINIFESMISQANLIEPDYHFLEKYRELYDHARDVPLDSDPEGNMQALYRELEELIFPPIHDWQPRNQLEFVVKALENLEEHGPDENLLRDTGESFIHLKTIYAEVERLAVEAGKEYDWSAIDSSIRGRINENIGNPPGQGSYFVRAGGMSGRYRLSDAGYNMIRERRSKPQSD